MYPHLQYPLLKIFQMDFAIILHSNQYDPRSLCDTQLNGYLLLVFPRTVYQLFEVLRYDFSLFKFRHFRSPSFKENVSQFKIIYIFLRAIHNLLLTIHLS